jgi:selenocysteine lyase/cysteine desulfurase
MQTFSMSPVNRRHFLQKIGAISATAFAGSLFNTAWAAPLQEALISADGLSPADLADDEEFWYHIQQSYTVPQGFINLNNGGVSPQPKIVQEALELNNKDASRGPSYFMWRVMDKGREPLRKDLANLAGCSAEEIAINRNATEALETIVFGLELKRGDEVVLTKQDYPNMINAWKQREIREGIKLVWLNLELPSEDPEYLASQYINAFTPRTRVVHITHMINWIGQIIPVKKVAQEAHKRGIEVLVDGAHTFGQFDYKIPDLHCDYFGTSLHKWLCAPIGSGMLYVKKEKIKKLYPLFGSADPHSEDIRKYESLGTRSFAIEQAIGKAIEFHEMIRIERKQARLHFLKNYWMQKVKDIPRVQLKTSLNPAFACAIGLVAIEGKKPIELDQYLFDHYNIHTVGIEWENIHGVRITPNVYTSVKQLDVLVEAIAEFAKK